MTCNLHKYRTVAVMDALLVNILSIKETPLFVMLELVINGKHFHRNTFVK